MMEDEENSIDEFAFDLLRRAKERSQLISGKLRKPEHKDEHVIEKMMQKLEKKTSATSVKSPEKSRSSPNSPSKSVTRPILKPIMGNDDDGENGNVQSERNLGQKKKSVTTCDAITGDTIVEAKTYTDDTAFMETEEDTYDGIEELPKDEDAEPEPAGSSPMQTVSLKEEATPKLSKTLKKLAEFHSMEEVDSPVHPHTPLETFNYGNGEDFGHVSASKRARSSRLSALARTINEWEDDTTHHSIPGSRFNESSNTRASLAGRARYATAASPSASSPLGGGGKQGQIAGELQGFSRRQCSPLKQIREKSPVIDEENVKEMRQKTPSPKKTYFGGSPTKGTPTKTATPPSKSPRKSVNTTSQPACEYKSPAKSASPAVNNSPHKYVSPVRVIADNHVRQSQSPVKSFSPQKHVAGSPLKNASKSNSNESTPTVKPVSAIRMRFEGGGKFNNVGPPKPERSRGKPYPSQGIRPAQPSSSPVKKFHFGETEKDPSTLSVAQRAKLFENSNFCLASKKPIVVDVQPKRAIFTSSPRLDSVKPQDIDVSSVIPVPPLPIEHARQKSFATTSTPANTSPSRPPPPPPMPPIMPNTSTPTNSKRRSTSPARQFPVEDHAVKRIKVNAPKPGRMYPSLTDIETETETEGHCSEVESMNDSIESEQSLGAEIETIAKAYSPIRPEYSAHGKPHQRYRPSEDFSATFACAEVDACIDEALEGQLDGTTMDCSTTMFEAERTINAAPEACTIIDEQDEERSLSSSLNQTPPEETSYSDADTTASSSFASSPVPLPNFSAISAAKIGDQKLTEQKAGYQSPVTKPAEEEITIPRQLMHTVSFYRKQQQQQKKVDTYSALNEICEQHETSDDSVEDAVITKPDISETIRKLEDEVDAHNLAIAQASKALNLCKALVGFSDSTEHIECERILLIETQKRLALLNSIHRMKSEGALSRQLPAVFSPSKQEVTPSCKGNMKISNISVTLRREFFNARRAECQYHFICLLKNKHQIDHTVLLTYDSQKQGSVLRFPNEFHLQSLDPDFQVNLEIYYLESAKEFLPHEAKYRINAKKDSKQSTLLSPLLTPSKKSGKGEGASKLLSRPQMHSPAGPDTIKSSSFKFCGSLSVDISSLQRTYWELDKVSGPLSGAVNLKLQCSAMTGVEHRGFLTLFEDVSGFGAWVRRWCRLGPTSVEFWKYPEDETECKKPPLSTLNLHECVTSKVRPAPREVCARANTLLLVTTRAPHPKDSNTLVTSCHKGYTAVRHLISADTREERDLWSHQLSKALANLRAWDPVAKQSVDDNVF